MYKLEIFLSYGWIEASLLKLFPFFRLQVNIDGCVNTLSDYCKTFFKEYGRDGRNYTARAIYDCYFDPTEQVGALVWSSSYPLM